MFKDKCRLLGFEDFHSYQGRCYKYVKSQKTYSEALKECNDYSTESVKCTLVSVRNTDENDFLSKLNNRWGWQAWIGIEKKIGIAWKDYQGNGKWADGLNLKQTSWTNWDTGEPNSVNTPMLFGNILNKIKFIYLFLRY